MASIELVQNEIGVQTVSPMPDNSDSEDIYLPSIKRYTPRNQLKARHFEFNLDVIKHRIQEDPYSIQKTQSRLEKIQKDESRSKRICQEYQLQAIKMINIQRKKDEVTSIIGS